MKQLALFVCGITLLQECTNTNAHFKPFHADTSLSTLPLPVGIQPTSSLSQFDLKTTLSISKTIAFMTFLSSSPKLLCFVPSYLIVDFLTQLSCNPTTLNAIPHHVLTGFMTSLSANPTLINSIPKTVFVSINKTLSIGSPSSLPSTLSPVITVSDNVAVTIAPDTPFLPHSPISPAIEVRDKVVATITPDNPVLSSAPQSPAIVVSKNVSATVEPAIQPALPAVLPPVIEVNGEAAVTITPPGTSSQNLPDISITKDVDAKISPPISPSPTVPVLTVDSTNEISLPNANTPVGGFSGLSEPCKTVKTPSITLPLPTIPSLIDPEPLAIISSFFNKGAGNSILESKIKSIFKLLTSGNLKLPKPHVPVPEKTITHTNNNKPKIFVLLPSSLIGKPIDISPAHLSKLYYKPGSLDQILNVVYKRLPTPGPLNLPKLPVPGSNPSKCLPLFPKFPC